jgi:hypothetical protein
MRQLRRQVALQMVRAHGISRALAILHVSQMDISELEWRQRKYAGMELSVVRCNQQSGPDFYQVFGFATATARRTAFNPVPELPIEQRNGQESARAGRKKPGQIVARALSAGH